MADAEGTKYLGEEQFTINQSMVRGETANDSEDTSRLVKASLLLPIIAVPASIVSIFAMKKEIKDYLLAKMIPAVMEGGDKALRKIKSELLKNIHGKILDVGAGGGGYFRYYASSQGKVENVVLLEPCENLHPVLENGVQKLKNEYESMRDVSFEVTGGYLEDLGEELTGTFDNVIFGNVLCEVPNQAQAVDEVVRLLKPGGRIYFVEHVAAPRGTSIEKFQNTVNPLWSKVSMGCNCNRHTLEVIDAHPALETISWGLRMPGPLFIDRFVVGVAVKSSPHARL